jgi:drug/metabolite transporter (DMT)-like permease
MPASRPMKSSEFGLYAVTVFAWSTSWVAVKMQVGVVSPEVSVLWRFAIAGVLMFGWARVARLPLRFPLSAHARFAALGACLFSCNFLLFYYGSQVLASGLLSVIFSLASIFNMLLGAAIYRQRIERRVGLGALLGAVGVALMFWPEVTGIGFNHAALVGLGLCVGGTLFFCFGNMISASNQAAGLPLIPSTAWGMAYGVALLALLALVFGRPFIVELTPGYLGALVWLAVVASVVAFYCYLTLLGRIGAARAGYATVMFPVFALVISTIFEGYVWTVPAVIGLGAVLLGNLVVLGGKRAS